MKPLSIAAGIAAVSLIGAAGAQNPGSRNWPNWRGPNFNGSTEASNLPVKFSPTENVRWATDLPGPSAATPAIWGNHVFVSSAQLEEKKLLALCLDRATGKIRWQQDVGSGYQPAGMGNPVALDEKSNYASPSPATDGKRVVFFYGNGDLVAFDFDGNKLWSRNLQKENGDFCFGWTFSSTPQFFEGKLYVQILQRDRPVGGRGKDGAESYLMALDPATGKELWRSVRPSPARMESREAFTTPIPHVNNGRKEILLAGGDILSGHDPATGKELWRWGTWNQGHARPDYRLVPSPVAGGGMVLGCGPKREPVFAVKLGQNGDLTESGPAWKSELRGPVTSDVPTPLFYKGKFYVASDQRKNVSCVEPADGKVLWTTELPGPAAVWASPTAADGKIYLMSLKGDVHVVDAASGTLLATNEMAVQENELRSAIAVAYDHLFIRTNTRLYCIGK